MTLPEIPGYQLEREIGVGGMARVYLAIHTALDRRVAMKVMAPALVADPAFSKRFLREARTLAGLTHPNIVAVYDVGATDALLHYFAMQHLENGDMSARITRGIPETEVVRIISVIAKALGFAHQRGVIHRDVTPGNIMFDGANNPVLTDFGIARSEHGSTRITQTGVSIGTSSYMSPEQARGGEIDQRSDLYSLGALTFEALTGHPPYKGADGFAVAYAHVFEPIPRLPAYVSHWQSFINKVLAKDPNERFDNAEQFAMGLSDVGVSAQRIVPQRVLNKVSPAMPVTAANLPRPAALQKPLNVDARALAPIKQVIAPSASTADRPTLPLRAMPMPAQRNTEQIADNQVASKRAIWPLALAALTAIGLGVGGWWLQQQKPNKEFDPIVAEADPGSIKTELDRTAITSPTLDKDSDSVDPLATDPRATDPSAPEFTDPLDPMASDLVDGAEALDPAAGPPLASQFGPPTRATFVKPWLFTGAALAKKNQCFLVRSGAVDFYRLALSIDTYSSIAQKGIADCFATITPKIDALLAQDAPDVVAFLAELSLIEKSALAAGTGSKEALLLASERKRIVTSLLARGKPLEVKWQGSAAEKLYQNVLLLEPTNAVALAGVKRAPGIGKPGFAFSDSMKSGGKSSAMSIIGAGEVILRDAKGGTARVIISDNFAVARSEVTFGEYRRFAQASGYRGSTQGCKNIEGFALFVSKDRTWQKPGFEQTDRHPVVCVDFADAQAYARWLSKETGENYRLLSEAEWQLLAKAAPAPGCRSGNIGDSKFGTQFDERKVYGCSDNFAATAPAGNFGADRNNLVDLTGNAREWVEDCWNPSLALHPKGGAAWQTGRCGNRIAMGTSWISTPSETSTVIRTSFDSDARNNTVGFRVARTVAQIP